MASWKIWARWIFKKLLAYYCGLSTYADGFIYLMKKPSFPVRIAILMAILCIPPIGATQIGWYYFGQEMGVNFGMVAGVISVITAAYLMYQMGWRDDDDDDYDY